MEIDGIGVLNLGEDGSHIAWKDKQHEAGQDLIVETTLGPGLILALAKHDTWCLRASAVKINDRHVAFVGDRGNGKSTLAACSGLNTNTSWQRVVDDILPINLADATVELLPRFPQLKLSPDRQPGQDFSGCLALNALYILAPEDGGVSDVQIQPLDGQDAVLPLIRHTVAARLFDSSLLARHLAASVEIATRIPIRRLSFPRELEMLPEVQQAVTVDVGIESHHASKPINGTHEALLV